jgi:hypothetical protein
MNEICIKATSHSQNILHEDSLHITLKERNIKRFVQNCHSQKSS